MRRLAGGKGLRSPAELVLASDTDLMPVDRGNPVLRLGGFRLDAGHDRIGSPP